MIGQKVAHYRILEKIGAGGMGVVYKAQDTRLDRIVALKFLPSHLTSDEAGRVRFLQEARAASALNHPNVCTIHGIEEDGDRQFIVMEFVDGVTLRQKSPVKDLAEATKYAIQISEALKAAHGKGIVHRDIKSENIMLTGEGRIKVTDFGLAMIKGESSLTRTPAALGTMAYMSPEQAQGMDVDHRTDLWSLGVVMYEMITGELPFKADHHAALMYAIVHEEMPSLQEINPDFPPELTGLVQALLEKDRERRIGSADEVVQRFRKLKADLDSGKPSQRTNRTKSIAVLPFANLSPDPDNEFFAAGITDEITGSLSRLQQLKVCSRSMALQYRGKLIDPRVVGKDLSADVILEGSIRRIGNRIRLAVGLTDARTGFQLWAESFDRQIEDVFAVQDEIARTVVEALELHLTSTDRTDLLQKYKTNAQAYDEYLRGRFLWNKRQVQATMEAIEHLRRAIEIDPGYALAYTDLATCYSLLSNYAWMDSKEAYRLGDEILQKAISLDPDLDEVQVVRGEYFFVQCDLDQAKAQYERALQSNRSHVTAHHWLAYVYLARGDFANAIRENQEALRLEPLSLIINAYAGFAHFCMKNYQLALQSLDKAVELESSFSAGHHIKAWILAWMGRYDEALRSVEDAEKIWTADHRQLLTVRGVIEARRGNAAAAEKYVDRLKTKEKSGTFVHPFEYACIHAALGQQDKMLNALERAAGVRFYWWFTLLKVHPVFEPYREDARFKEIVKKLAL